MTEFRIYKARFTTSADNESDAHRLLHGVTDRMGNAERILTTALIDPYTQSGPGWAVTYGRTRDPVRTKADYAHIIDTVPKPGDVTATWVIEVALVTVEEGLKNSIQHKLEDGLDPLIRVDRELRGITVETLENDVPFLHIAQYLHRTKVYN